MMLGLIFWVSILFILYVYLGYPLMVAVLGRVVKPLDYYPQDFPLVTLLFAAHNEERVLAKKLENCLALDYPRDQLQILVVDDGSSDQTAAITRSYANRKVELISFPNRRGKLSAVTDVLQHVQGEIILFSDADNFYPADVLQVVTRYFSNEKIGAVSGGRNVMGDTLLGNSESLYWKYEEFIKRQESRLGSCVGVAGDLLAVRKSLYTPPPAGTINDDFFTGLSVIRKGYRVIYAPDARSYHPVAGNESGEIERRARMVAGRYQVIFSGWRMLPWENWVAVWEIISHKYFRPLVPFAMLTAIASNVLACLIPAPTLSVYPWLVLSDPYQWILLFAQLVFYISAGLGARYKFPGIVGKVFYLPTFLVNSNLAALKGFYRFITSKQSVVWKSATR